MRRLANRKPKAKPSLAGWPVQDGDMIDAETLPPFYKPRTPFEWQRSPTRAEFGRRGREALLAAGAERLAEGKAEVYRLDDFLTDAECRALVVLIYLDRPEAGGATRFPYLEIEANPCPGHLLAWNNMDLHGAPNSWTIHQGLTVEAGVKHIITRWFRERPWGTPPS